MISLSHVGKILWNLPPEIVLVLIIMIILDVSTKRREVVKILRRSPPVIVLVLILIVLDSLTTWGHDLDVYVLDYAPILYVFVINVRLLKYRLGNVRIVLRCLWYICKWLIFKDVFLNVVTIFFGIITTICLVPALNKHEHHGYLISNKSHLLLTKQNLSRMVDGIIIKESYRYPGEDIKFSCKFPNDMKGLHFKWIHDGVIVKETWRHKIFSRSEPNKEEINSTLSIMLLGDKDFGNYSCWIFYQIGKFFLERYKIREFILLKQPKFQQELTLPPLGLLSVQITYLSSGEEDDIYFVHLVDDQPFLCTDDDASYILYYHRAINKRQITDNRMVQHNTGDGLSIFISMTCMCPLAYGVHSFSVLRRVYNSSSLKWQMVEVAFPETLFISSMPSPFMSYFTETSNSSYANMSTIFKEYAFMFHFIEMFFVVLFAWWCWYPSNRILDILVLPLKIMFCFAPDFICKRLKDPTAHNTPVYIACEETDAQWCATFLSPVFDKLSNGTFIPLIDTHPGQGELEGMREGMDRCSRYLIVLAGNEEEASPLLKYQVDIIIYRLVRDELSADSIRILRVNHASYSDLDDTFRVKSIRCIHIYDGMSRLWSFWAAFLLNEFAIS